jgi:hypothetical protein
MMAPPAAASAVGYNHLTFYDDFDSSDTIDLADTRAAGFNWYTHNSWPVASHPAWPMFRPTPSSRISVSNSILTCGGENPDPPNLGNFLATAAANPDDFTKCVGQSFTNGFYAECKMAIQIPDQNDHGWPAFWAWSIEANTRIVSAWNEFDFFEQPPDPKLQHFAVWHETPPTNANQNSNSSGYLAGALTKQNVYGCRWVPMAQNRGTGLVDFYFNNSRLAKQAVTYSATSPVTPGMSGPNPQGMLCEIDSQHYYIIFGWGRASPSIAVDWVRVWQL